MTLTLITGGTGKTGRRIVQRLTATGHPTRVGSRTGTPPLDWDDRSTWEPALAGCTAAYLAFAPDVAFAGASGTVGAFSKTAVDAGVTRLVLLSGRGEEGAEQAEEAVRQSGADVTVVRSAFFAQNFSESLFLGSVLAGELAMVPDVGEPFVDADDIADVVVAALTEPGHEGQVYELTGPRLLTFADATREISAAIGRPVVHRALPPDEFAADLASVGVPHEEAQGLAHLFAEVLDGRNAHVADGVRRALGREPRDFGAYAAATAAAGTWGEVRRG